MSPLLRIEMLILALTVIAVIVHSVNKKKMCVGYSLVWIFISILIITIAVFPGIVFWFCEILGIETPSNLVYLFGILALLMITFMQTGILSKQSERIKHLTQMISIERYEKEEKNAHETE